MFTACILNIFLWVALCQQPLSVLARNESINHGAWEARDADHLRALHLFDGQLCNEIVKMFEQIQPKPSVIEMGAGPGTYTLKLRAALGDEMVRAFDGTPNIASLTDGVVQEADLSVPLEDVNAADWVMSLEVGEHIPNTYEDEFLNNIDNHALNGVLLSWAVLGQGGQNHVNCHSSSYIVALMAERGFVLHLDYTSWLRAHSSLEWFRHSLMVFERLHLRLPQPPVWTTGQWWPLEARATKRRLVTDLSDNVQERESKQSVESGQAKRDRYVQVTAASRATVEAFAPFAHIENLLHVVICLLVFVSGLLLILLRTAATAKYAGSGLPRARAE